MGVIFTYAKKPPPPMIHDAIGIKYALVRGDGFGRFTVALSVQPLIGKIGKIHDAVRNTIGASSVFMDTRTNVQWGRGQVV